MLRNEFIYINGLGFYSRREENLDSINENLDSIEAKIKELADEVAKHNLAAKAPICMQIESQIKSLQTYLNGFNDERVKPIWSHDKVKTLECLEICSRSIQNLEKEYINQLAKIERNAQKNQNR